MGQVCAYLLVISAGRGKRGRQEAGGLAAPILRTRSGAGKRREEWVCELANSCFLPSGQGEHTQSSAFRRIPGN